MLEWYLYPLMPLGAAVFGVLLGGLIELCLPVVPWDRRLREAVLVGACFCGLVGAVAIVPVALGMSPL
jgi:hypothetical protein